MKKSASVLLFLLCLMQTPVFADNYERVNIYYNNGINYFKDKKYSSSILEFKKVLRQRPYDITVQINERICGNRADYVVHKRHVALHGYVRLFGHAFPFVLNPIPPLVSVGVPHASASVLTETVKVFP